MTLPPKRSTARDIERYAGLFAAPAKSPFWTRYRRNLHKALRVPYDFMLEQDALNVAIQEVGNELRAPSTVNWLCSLALPMKRPIIAPNQ